MPLAVPPELKKIAPYIRRAEELDKDKSSAESRLVSYYLRQYAVHLGIPLASSSAAAKTCLGHILGSLESEKAAMDNFTKEEAAFLCRKFANKVFDKADEEDRMGLANKETAKTFYAAASFLTMLEQFAPTASGSSSDGNADVAEDKKRILYAKWKATDILKAIKEGRSPTPGGYGEEEEEDKKQQQQEADEKKQDAPTFETVQQDDSDDDTGFIPLPPSLPPGSATLMEPVPPPVIDKTEQEDDDNNSKDGEDVDYDDEGTEVQLGPPPAYPGGGKKDNGSLAPTTTIMPGRSSADRPPVTFDVPSIPPPFIPTPAPAPPKPKQTHSGVGGIFGFGKHKNKATKAELADAMELTRFALAALEDKDADVAAERLQQALRALGR